MYGIGNSVVLADGNTVDVFESLEDYSDLSSLCDMLQELGVDNDKLRGVVAAWALRKAGLE